LLEARRVEMNAPVIAGEAKQSRAGVECYGINQSHARGAGAWRDSVFSFIVDSIKIC